MLRYRRSSFCMNGGSIFLREPATGSEPGSMVSVAARENSITKLYPALAQLLDFAEPRGDVGGAAARLDARAQQVRHQAGALDRLGRALAQGRHHAVGRVADEQGAAARGAEQRCRSLQPRPVGCCWPRHCCTWCRSATRIACSAGRSGRREVLAQRRRGILASSGTGLACVDRKGAGKVVCDPPAREIRACDWVR